MSKKKVIVLDVAFMVLIIAYFVGCSKNMSNGDLDGHDHAIVNGVVCNIKFYVME